ncbi:PQQ-binding-like beta-propeller repeat protein [Halorubellus litoreus]|uniref:PQQ-binding-like beta-propeller repeat protein n=1 Tax=Halorubellus litoreus TaxID=755308 RepID=A0ABD5VEA7_9EURY
MGHADDERRGIDRRLLLRALGAGAFAGASGNAAGSGERAGHGASERHRERGRSRCVVDDFQDGDLDEYVARDGPMANWRVASFRNGRVLEFQGGDGPDLQSYSGLETYPRRGDQFSFLFYPYGNWDGYAMFSFAIADSENFQRRYELEFEPAADEVRLQYSRAPGDEETIASASRSFDGRDRQIVEVDWAASSDDIVVTVTDPDDDGTTLRASEPGDAPTGGGIGFYASGDAGWLFDYVTILDCDDRSDGDDGDDQDGLVVDDFEDGDLDEYDGGDPPTNWTVVSEPTADGSGALQFQDGGGEDIRSYRGLPTYPQRGDRIHLDFGTFGDWNSYAMFGFGVQPDDFQHRYELEFEPAESEVRLQYSRAPQDETTIASATADFQRERFYRVEVDWASSGTELVVDVAELATLRASEPSGAPTSGGIGFYASGDAGWVFDNVRRVGQHDDGRVPSDRDWPTVQHDFANTSWTRASRGPTDGVEEAWSKLVSLDRANEAVVDDDVVYATGTGRRGGLYALSADTGTVRWRYPIQGGTYAPASIVDGSAYLIGNDRFGHAVDVSTGERRWRTAFEDTGEVAAVVAGDTVVFGDYSSLVTGVDASDGTVRFSANLSDGVQGGMAVVDDVVYAAGIPSGGLNAIDLGTGEFRWRTLDYGEAGITPPSVVDDTVYVGEQSSGSVYALSVTDGRVRWRFDVVPSSSLAVADGCVFAPTGDGRLYALDATDGSVRWRRTLNIQTGIGGPSVADDVVYVADTEGGFYALDAEDGCERWVEVLDYTIRGSPAVVDDTIYVGGSDGRVHALREP